MAQDNAFVDEFTTSYNDGTSYFIQVDPSFTTQIADIASIIARVANADEQDPAAFVDSFTTRAQDALPPSPAAPTGEDDESAPTSAPAAKDTPDSLAAKRALLKDLLQPLTQSEAKLQNIPDRDFIGFTNLVLSLLLSLFSESEELADLTRSLVRAIAAENPTPASHTPAMSTRYTALATIFNALPTSATSSALRREVLETLVAYAAKNDDLSIVRPALENHQLEQDHLAATGDKDTTTASIVRSLIGNVVDGSRTDPLGTLRLARELLVDRLSSSAEGSSSQEETREKLQKTLMALLLASNEVYDLTPFARIVPTASEDALSKTFKLFLSGNSSDALPTQADLESALSSSTLIPSSSSSSSAQGLLALDRSELEKKLKLLQLARLCEDRVGKEVGYEEIAKRLGLQGQTGEEGEEVEEWVIDAVRASLVQGRLSQPTHSFFVTRAAPLSFSSSSSQCSDSWRTIEERLQGWKEALERVTGSVEKSLGFAAATAAGGEKGPRREVNGRFAEEVVQNQQQQQAIEA
ncbi:hypothetical protein JCM10908_001317 [Rhodotorula pacifica]|uniref:uncharacterized protein n=1 Tax=Rhodotorula pacifica TaxID=1495444 RepID=UPI0031815BFC